MFRLAEMANADNTRMLRSINDVNTVLVSC